MRTVRDGAHERERTLERLPARDADDPAPFPGKDFVPMYAAHVLVTAPAPPGQDFEHLA